MLRDSSWCVGKGEGGGEGALCMLRFYLSLMLNTCPRISAMERGEGGGGVEEVSGRA